MSAYAQTNIQLYNQLHQSGWNDWDCAAIRAAHDLAAALSRGQLRPNYKPLLSHLVGTASIVAAHASRAQSPPQGTTHASSPVDLVTAAILHSAYLLGAFGDRRRSHPDSRRRVVRETIGDFAERIVYRFTSLSGRTDELMHLGRQYPQLTALEQAAVVVKLADIHEEYLDQGVCYSPCKDLTDSHTREVLLTATTLAGGPAWSAALQAAFAAAEASTVPAVLVSTRQQSFVPAAPLHARLVQRFLRPWFRRDSAA
jgi:hypothetical protein